MDSGHDGDGGGGGSFVGNTRLLFSWKKCRWDGASGFILDFEESLNASLFPTLTHLRIIFQEFLASDFFFFSNVSASNYT